MQKKLFTSVFQTHIQPIIFVILKLFTNRVLIACSRDQDCETKFEMRETLANKVSIWTSYTQKMTKLIKMIFLNLNREGIKSTR
jgi:hypothetical protein